MRALLFLFSFFLVIPSAHAQYLFGYSRDAITEYHRQAYKNDTAKREYTKLGIARAGSDLMIHKGTDANVTVVYKFDRSGRAVLISELYGCVPCAEERLNTLLAEPEYAWEQTDSSDQGIVYRAENWIARERSCKLLPRKLHPYLRTVYDTAYNSKQVSLHISLRYEPYVPGFWVRLFKKARRPQAGGYLNQSDTTLRRWHTKQLKKDTGMLYTRLSFSEREGPINRNARLVQDQFMIVYQGTASRIESEYLFDENERTSKGHIRHRDATIAAYYEAWLLDELGKRWVQTQRTDRTTTYRSTRKAGKEVWLDGTTWVVYPQLMILTFKPGYRLAAEYLITWEMMELDDWKAWRKRVRQDKKKRSTDA